MLMSEADLVYAVHGGRLWPVEWSICSSGEWSASIYPWSSVSSIYSAE